MGLTLSLQLTDAMALPFADNSIDAVVIHQILTVIPHPIPVLQEASLVIKPGGKIHILNKSIKLGERDIFQRLINKVLRHIASLTDVVFDNLHACCDELTLIHDEPAIIGEWFRYIEQQKRQ